MALPTLEKTWQHNVNQSTATSGSRNTDAQALWLKVKNALTGFASGAWTVVSSSNGITAGAGDHWSSASDIGWASGSNPHSWIVLRQTGLATNCEVCIDLNVSSSYPNQGSIVISYAAGFTGGSTSARPTATDERVLASATTLWSVTSAIATVLHVMMSTTGENTRIVICANSAVVAQWYFEKLADSALANPVVAAVKGDATTVTTLCGTTSWCGIKDATQFAAYMGTEYYNNNYTINANSGASSDISSAYPIVPLSLHSETTGAKGRAGRLVDLWGGSSSFAIAATYPAAPDNKQFVQFSQFVYPWDGSTPVIV